MELSKETHELLSHVTFDSVMPFKTLVTHASMLLLDLDRNTETNENLKDTPSRFAKYLSSHFKPKVQIETELKIYADSIFPSSYEGILTVKNGEASGICPHHLLPVLYNFNIGYIPSGYVIGLSKLIRIPELILNLPGLQEDLTQLVAFVLQDLLGTGNIAFTLNGKHTCMLGRGVEARDADTVTSVIRGVFLNEGPARSEFFELTRR